jgi:DNA-binding Lrp family transcriptional regulator
VIAAYILIQTEAGKAATVAAALRELPDVSETASLAGPYDIIVRAEAPDLDALGRLLRSQVQVIDGVSQTTSCPVVHL